MKKTCCKKVTMRRRRYCVWWVWSFRKFMHALMIAYCIDICPRYGVSQYKVKDDDECSNDESTKKCPPNEGEWRGSIVLAVGLGLLWTAQIMYTIGLKGDINYVTWSNLIISPLFFCLFVTMLVTWTNFILNFFFSF